MDIIRVFLISDFLAESLKANKTSEKITYFIIQFRSKNLTHFTYLNSLEIEKSMLPKHSQKPFSLHKFSSKHLVGVRKIHLHCTISRHPRTALSKHFESKCLYISVYLRKKRFFPSGGVRGRGGEGEEGRIIYLRWLPLGLVKCFTIFHFTWNVWKFNYFSAFRYFHL